MARLAACLLAIALTGCTTIIHPPVAPEDPVSVVVADYGYHSSLLLPLPDGGSMEYAFGEWDWFALNRDEWYRVCGTLCCPNQGALGRRRLSMAPTRAVAEGALYCREAHEIRVARASADLLAKRLDDRFRKNLETRVYNPVLRLEFVHDEIDYCFFVNCNHVLARWLRELGCELDGSACFSSFRVEAPQRHGGH